MMTEFFELVSLLFMYFFPHFFLSTSLFVVNLLLELHVIPFFLSLSLFLSVLRSCPSTVLSLPLILCLFLLQHYINRMGLLAVTS